jgi:hypothetical protein
MAGHCIVQLRLIFRAVPLPQSQRHPIFDQFLAYVQRFDIVPQAAASAEASQLHRGSYPDPVTKMYVLKRSTRADSSRMGDVIPLTNLRASADLIPRFYEAADTHLTKKNSLEYSREFYHNKYFVLCFRIQRRIGFGMGSL